LALLSIALFFPQAKAAGGDSFPAEIIEFTPKGKDEYRLVVELQVQANKTNRLVLHLRHHASIFGKHLPNFVTKENYLACIERLKTYARERKKFRLGFLGTGYVPIPGKKNEFQSNSLSLLAEFTDEKVIYSMARPI
jgi:hypothetical protein